MTRGLIVVASLALSAVTFGQTGADKHTIERAFSEGGIVTLHLSSGDYTVRAGASDRVRFLPHSARQGAREGVAQEPPDLRSIAREECRAEAIQVVQHGRPESGR